MLVPLFSNVTVPVGLPFVELTVAVNVTVFPKTEGLREEVRVAATPAFWMTWLNADDVLPL
jgi:hypothetical protein